MPEPEERQKTSSQISIGLKQLIKNAIKLDSKQYPQIQALWDEGQLIYVNSTIQVCVYLWHSSLSLGVKWRLEELKGRCLEACCSSCCDRGVIPQFQRSEKFVQSTKFCIHPSGPLQSRECEAAGDNHMLSKYSSKTQSLFHQIIQDHCMYLTTTGGRVLHF